MDDPKSNLHYSDTTSQDIDQGGDVNDVVNSGQGAVDVKKDDQIVVDVVNQGVKNHHLFIEEKMENHQKHHHHRRENKKVKRKIMNCSNWYLSLLGNHQVQSSSHSSQGKWIENRGLLELTLQRKRAIHSMGFTEKGGITFLFPEEMLILHGKGALDVYHVVEDGSEKNVLLSSENLFACIFSRKPAILEIECLHAYSHLISRNFIVRRRLDSTSSVERPPSYLKPSVALPEMQSLPIAFDVFSPSSTFSKKNPGNPLFCVIVCKYRHPRPNGQVLSKMIEIMNPVPLMLCVVDVDGSTVMYSLKKNVIPSIVVS